MEPTPVTASEFQMSFGALSDKARREPVVITKHDRDSLVVISAEEWERLKRLTVRSASWKTCLRCQMAATPPNLTRRAAGDYVLNSEHCKF
jgi:prevent-host-death family protein